MRVELLDPSGVGKTTVLGIAQAERSSEHDWMGPKDIDAYLKQVACSRDADTERQALNDPGIREFMEGSMEIVLSSAMPPAQRFTALQTLRNSCVTSTQLRHISQRRLLVHDELLLHRAFSLLPQAVDVERDATRYFLHVPVPDAAAIFVADPSVIISHTLDRRPLPNCYQGLDEQALHATVERLLRVCLVAEQTLRARGVTVAVIDNSGTPNESAIVLQDFITKIAEEHSVRDYAGDLKERLLSVSGSFQKKGGRHQLRTRNVYYCGFGIPGFDLERDRSQRDARARVARFGLNEKSVRRASVLDLGANVGAMLFQLSNFGICSGLGIEADEDKVRLAREVAEYAGLPHVRFEMGDIDLLDPQVLGLFDVVLALAVEKHVLDPDRLYWLLGRVTRRLLCFEGNSGCDVDYVRARLLAEGFDAVEYLGLCDDDILPENNRRPLLIAYKRDDTPGNLDETSRTKEAVSQARSRIPRNDVVKPPNEHDKLRSQLEAARNSLSYRLGNLLVEAVVSPGRNTILLPYRLVRLCMAGLKKRRSQRRKGRKGRE